MSAVPEMVLPEDLIECFMTRGGVRYEVYHGFHDVVARSSHPAVAKRSPERVLTHAGLDDQLRSGICVLDVVCGDGSSLLRLAREFPNSRFMGYDLCVDTVQRAQGLASDMQLSNIAFYRWDAATMQDEGAFDLITAFGAIHDQQDRSAVLRNSHRALKHGGTFLIQDIAHRGAGLGSMWSRETAVQMLNEAGFRDVEIGKVPQDTTTVYYVARKGERG